MFLCRPCTRVLAWVPLVLLPVLGCESTPRRLDPPELSDDFGSTVETDDITEESVNETQMLTRRTQIEVKGGVSIPTGFFASNDFDPGPTAGLKAEIETMKDFFIGFSFDWANWQQGQGASSVGNPGDLASLSPDQLYGELDKFNILLVGDYDWTLTKSFLGEDMPLKIRLGAGLGAAIVSGELDPFIAQQSQAAGAAVSIQNYAGFLARLATSLRWQVTDGLLIFVEGGYDFVAPFTTELIINGQRSQVQGDIDFGSIQLGGGIAFEF